MNRVSVVYFHPTLEHSGNTDGNTINSRTGYLSIRGIYSLGGVLRNQNSEHPIFHVIIIWYIGGIVSH